MHHFDYLVVMAVFPIVLTGIMVLPGILLNKKIIFTFVPLGEILLYLKCIADLIGERFSNPIAMLQYYFSEERLIHLPVVFIPMLIFSIITANIGASVVHRFYTEINFKKKRELYSLYQDLDKIAAQEDLLVDEDAPIFFLLKNTEATPRFVFENLDTAVFELEFVNSYSMEDPLSDNENPINAEIDSDDSEESAEISEEETVDEKDEAFIEEESEDLQSQPA